MTQPTFTPPQAGATAFNCPHCGVYAQQRWGDVHSGTVSRKLARVSMGIATIPKLRLSWCDHCDEYAAWIGDAQVWPPTSKAPPANSDLPAELVVDYHEAAAVLTASPRSAAALLRLVVQKLCKHLGERGKKIDDDIGELVKKGLPVGIQRALDIVRITGNSAVHPGELDLNDNADIALSLFSLVNMIVENRISEPKKLEQLWARMPKGAVDAVGKRDEKQRPEKG